jgi:hypothetical protein
VWLASPLRIANKEFGNLSISTSLSQLTSQLTPLGEYGKYIQMFSLLQPNELSVFGVDRSDIVDTGATVRQNSPLFPQLDIKPTDPVLRLLLVSTKRKIKGKVEKLELSVLGASESLHVASLFAHYTTFCFSQFQISTTTRIETFRLGIAISVHCCLFVCFCNQ